MINTTYVLYKKMACLIWIGEHLSILAVNFLYIFSACGEPPLCMSCSVLFALKHAVEAARSEMGKDTYFRLGIVCTSIKYLLKAYYLSFTDFEVRWFHIWFLKNFQMSDIDIHNIIVKKQCKIDQMFSLLKPVNKWQMRMNVKTLKFTMLIYSGNLNHRKRYLRQYFNWLASIPGSKVIKLISNR